MHVSAIFSVPSQYMHPYTYGRLHYTWSQYNNVWGGIQAGFPPEDENAEVLLSHKRNQIVALQDSKTKVHVHVHVYHVLYATCVHWTKGLSCIETSGYCIYAVYTHGDCRKFLFLCKEIEISDNHHEYELHRM